MRKIAIGVAALLIVATPALAVQRTVLLEEFAGTG
jgi:hypothetical protein